MKLQMNGRTLEVHEGISVEALLRERRIDPATAVVEHNRRVLSADALPSTLLAAGDELEVVRFVGGG